MYVRYWNDFLSPRKEVTALFRACALVRLNMVCGYSHR